MKTARAFSPLSESTKHPMMSFQRTQTSPRRVLQLRLAPHPRGRHPRTRPVGSPGATPPSRRPRPRRPNLGLDRALGIGEEEADANKLPAIGSNRITVLRDGGQDVCGSKADPHPRTHTWDLVGVAIESEFATSASWAYAKPLRGEFLAGLIGEPARRSSEGPCIASSAYGVRRSSPAPRTC
jgi:hypothetical protein